MSLSISQETRPETVDRALTLTQSFTPLPGPTAGLKIGLFGGSFNPAHQGHLHVAETALKRLQLDWVWWIVARGNPLKSNHGDFQKRLASAKHLAQRPRMIATSFEADIGCTYTVDTLSILKARAPGTHFCWIMGADNLNEFHHWRSWSDIARMAPICVVARPGHGTRGLNSVFARTFSKTKLQEHSAPALPFHPAPAWVYLKAPLHPISSSDLRKAQGV